MLDGWTFEEMLNIIERKIQELESQMALEPRRTNYQLLNERENYKQMQSNIHRMMREQEKVI